MVDDKNNFDEARDALTSGLAAGLLDLYTDTLKQLDQNMRQGQDALGRSWEPVKASTLRSRQVRTDDARPLVDTSELRASIQSDSAINLARMRAVIGSSKEFLVHHEFGAPEAGIPRRPVLGPAAEYAAQNATDTIGDMIDTRLKDAEL
jgi:phage gpG-like protein